MFVVCYFYMGLVSEELSLLFCAFFVNQPQRSQTELGRIIILNTKPTSRNNFVKGIFRYFYS